MHFDKNRDNGKVFQFFSINPQAPVAQKIADEVASLNRTSLTPIRFWMRIFWKLPIKALPDFIFQWILYQDHILSQMVLWLIRTNEIEHKNNDVYSH